MKFIRYFFEYLIIKLLFLFFRLIGYKNSSNFGSSIGKIFGPIFKSKKIIETNIKTFRPDINEKSQKNLSDEMWGNYGRIFAEYMFIKDFRMGKLDQHIKINGLDYLDEIKKRGKPVVFVSAHFSNFELMAMHLEKYGIKLGALYRPLNNFFLNKTMEKIRQNYICKIQIKKGLAGIRDILNLFKKNVSLAMMIDQRVTEGIKCEFFNKPAYTTTIPAQLVKKFNCQIVPVYIERNNKFDFEITINRPISFDEKEDLYTITKSLNEWLEKMIKNKPEQWVWSHNRWKL